MNKILLWIIYNNCNLQGFLLLKLNFKGFAWLLGCLVARGRCNIRLVAQELSKFGLDDFLQVQLDFQCLKAFPS